MHCTIPLLLAALASFGAAAPTPTLVSRACTTITPSSMQSLLSTDPEHGTPNNNIHGSGVYGFSVFQVNFNASNRYHMLQFIDFEVPVGSYGCELYITDAGKSIQHSVYHDETMSMNSVATKFNVKSFVPNAFHSEPTYNDILNAPTSMISAEHFGDIQIAFGDVSRTINSEACPPLMSSGRNGHLQFVFGFSEDDDYSASYFSMTQRDAGHNGAVNGVYMTFNC